MRCYIFHIHYDQPCVEAQWIDRQETGCQVKDMEIGLNSLCKNESEQQTLNSVSRLMLLVSF